VPKDTKTKDEKTKGGSSDDKPLKTDKLKKDMEEYFEIQRELLDVLSKAEPLQAKAEAFKDRFK
jgi:hypothetical protein